MQTHFEQTHPSVEMSAELAAACTLAKHERDHVKQLLTKKTAKSVCPGTTCCPASRGKRRA